MAKSNPQKKKSVTSPVTAAPKFEIYDDLAVPSTRLKISPESYGFDKIPIGLYKLVPKSQEMYCVKNRIDKAIKEYKKNPQHKDQSFIVREVEASADGSRPAGIAIWRTK